LEHSFKDIFIKDCYMKKIDTIKRKGSLYQKNYTSRGVAIVETISTLAIVIPIILATIDLVRISYIKSVISMRLTQALKRAQSDQALQYDIWNNNAYTSGFNSFLDSRTDVSRIAVNNLNDFKLGLTGVTIQGVQHYDLASDQEVSGNILPIAYLPPGYSAHIPSWDATIHNPHRCSPTRAHSHGVTDREKAYYGHCDSTIDQHSTDDSLRNLSKKFPTVLASFIEVNTMIFGKKRLNIQVSGYPKIETPYQPRPATPPGGSCAISGPNLYQTCVSSTIGNIPHLYEGSVSGILNHRGLVTDNNIISRIIDGMNRERNYWTQQGHTWNYFMDYHSGLTISDQEICYLTANRTVHIDAAHACAEDSNRPSACGIAATVYCSRTGNTGCFHKDTKILLKGNIEKLVSDIQNNDEILNPLNGKTYPIRRLIRGPEKLSLFNFNVNGHQVRVTSTHPMLTQRGVVKAKEVTIQDKLLLEDGSFYDIQTIENKAENGEQLVYNIELESDDEDAFNRVLSSDGILTADYFVQHKINTQ
jgi:hypothetical protein